MVTILNMNIKLTDLTELDRLNLADIAWFIRGLNFGKEKQDQPFDDAHFNTLERVIVAIRKHELDRNVVPVSKACER
jgi:hypothetical protein